MESDLRSELRSDASGGALLLGGFPRVVRARGLLPAGGVSSLGS